MSIFDQMIREFEQQARDAQENAFNGPLLDHTEYTRLWYQHAAAQRAIDKVKEYRRKFLQGEEDE